MMVNANGIEILLFRYKIIKCLLTRNTTELIRTLENILYSFDRSRRVID